MIISDLSLSLKIDNLKDEILRLEEQGEKKDEKIMSQILLMNILLGFLRLFKIILNY